MKRHIPLALVLFALPTAAQAAMLIDGKGWAARWCEVKREHYAVVVNNAGDVSVIGPGRITIGMPVFCFFWRGKSYSMHHNVHGQGSWRRVEGKLTETPECATITVSGEVADLRVQEVIAARGDRVTMTWDAVVISPGPEMWWMRYNSGFFYCRGCPFEALSAQGRRMTGVMGDPFSVMREVSRVSIEAPECRVTIEWLRAARRCIRPNLNPKQRQCPMREEMEPAGLFSRAALMPGDRFGYTMRVAVTPTAQPTKP